MSSEAEIIAGVIREMCTYTLKRGKRPPWRRVPGWVDKHFKLECKRNPSLIQTYKESLGVLTRLQRWYDKCYTPETHRYLPNLPIYIPLRDHHVFLDKIDMLAIDAEGEITVFDFAEIQSSWTNSRLHIHTYLRADLVAAARVWGFTVAGKETPSQYTRFVINKKGIFPARCTLTEQNIRWIKQTIPFILDGIGRGIRYTVVSDQCPTCPWRQRCPSRGDR